MLLPNRCLMWVNWLSCWLTPLLLLTAAHSQNLPPAQSDEAALRTLINDLFATYPKEDLAGHLSNWSAQAPGLAAHRDLMEGIFARNERIEIKNLTVRRLTLEGAQAQALVEFDFIALTARTGRPVADEGKIYRALRFVKEDTGWKIWEDKPADSLLAQKLLAAPTTAERLALLAAEQDWMTASILAREGRYLLGDGKHQQALMLAQLAEQLAEQSGDRRAQSQALDLRAAVHQEQDQHEAALEHFARSLQLQKLDGHKPGIASALDNIAKVHYSTGNYGAAAEAFQQALKQREEIGEPLSIAIAQNNLGSVYRLLGDYRRAHELLQKSVQASDRGKAPVLHYRALLNLGTVYGAQSNYELALSYYQESLKRSEPIGNKVDIALAWNNIGTIYRAQNQFEMARAAHQKSLKVYEEIKNRTGQAGLATALHHLGNVYHYQGKHAEALQHLQRGLEIRQRLRNQARIASSLISIGEVHYATGQYAQALDVYEQASTLARQVGDPDLLLTVRTKAGQARLAAQQPDAARQAFTEAITTTEGLRALVAGDEQEQQRFFENKLDPYHAMVKLALAEGQPVEALSYAERARGRVLLDVLHSGRTRITKAMTAAEQEQERNLDARLSSLHIQLARAIERQPVDQARLTNLQAQLQKARFEYAAFQASLYTRQPELKTQRGQVLPLTLAEAGELLPDSRTALLEFVVTPEQALLFVLTKAATGEQATIEAAQLKVFPLSITQQALTERVTQLRRQIADRDPGFASSARSLYQLLLAPAYSVLQDKTTLVIVPDGPLWELPFQALKPTPNRFLIQEAAIFYAPSLAVLREMTRLRRQLRPTGAPALLALGNPGLGLPDAERQVRKIGRLYDHRTSKVYLGPAASEARLKSEAARYHTLLLATHGVLDDRNPLYSYLLLAPDRESEDGFLEAREIMKLDLQAELVVLSACETARGRFGQGEGVIGLTWALFVAGCPTTVASHWKVRADSTADLMIAFHRQLRLPQTNGSARRSTAAALRQATLQLMADSKYRHPFWWAGFVVIGDGF